ncbi:MAG: ABC transporter permease [Deltaproteobacteria bacterium]|jgi:arginine/ornithine transport system permease protein|nr:ABC transporter permease [Deltaproteobacteria bacterium]MBW2518237.1 ABC transporter permease [Deltaproteobacteria bacterium]
MDFQVIIDNLPLYLQGLRTTIVLVFASLILGLVLAIPIALLASSKRKWVAALPKAYIYFFRGTPLLVQMFMIYHGMGQFEAVRESFLWVIFQQAWACALVAFALNTAGYTGEILRGTIEQTPYGEIEAAKSVGMSNAQIYRRIILPSTFRRALPAYGNEVIFMLHGSSLAGLITIVDLFGAAKIVNARNFVPFESFIAAGIFYLAITFMIVYGFKKAEHYWHAYLRPRES